MVLKVRGGLVRCHRCFDICSVFVPFFLSEDENFYAKYFLNQLFEFLLWNRP